MQFSKKIYSTLIIAVLAISAIATAIPMVSALGGDPMILATPTPSWGTPITEIPGGTVGMGVSIVANASVGTPAAAYVQITAYWDTPTSAAILGTTYSDGDGYFRLDVKIPSAVTGTHQIIVNDGAGAVDVAFDVAPEVTVSTTPSTAQTGVYDAKVLPGDALTVVGHGFAGGMLGSAITIDLENSTDTITITSPSVTTNSTGSFSAVIVIPTIIVASYGDWDVRATDASTGTAIAPILLDYYNTVTPNRGPSGITITISGRIPASTPYTLLMDTTNIGSGTSGADGTFTNTFVIPELIADGDHNVYVKWVIATVESNRVTTFTVSAEPLAFLSALTGVPGATITISGTGFTPNAKISVTIGSTVANSTDLDSRFGPTTAGGAFTNEEFVVPALASGVYYVIVADEYGAATNGTTVFTITAAPTTSIALNGASYYTGDTLSFSITTTEQSMSQLQVTIYSPAGVVYWTAEWSGALPATPVKTVKFMDQVANDNPITIPADAPLGSWNWTILYKPQSLAFVTTKATGLFTVAALPTMQTVLDAIDAAEASITDVITTTEGDIIAVVNTKAGQIVADISDLDAKIESIDGAIVTLSTAIGEVQTTISNLDMGTLGADITAIKGDVATIKTNLGTVDMAVEDLDAKVSDIADGIATVQTNLGTLQGTVTSIDGTVATINTGVGSLQADVSDVSAKADVTPVWIAVVLSLVAAIAAIFAVITIRQKIAG